MKIGILTYHRSHNYGALLQAIALRKVLTGMGHDVTYVDYWPDYHRHMYSLINLEDLKELGIRGKCRYVKNIVMTLPYRKERIENFRSFISGHIEPYVSSPYDSYDLLIHGSDQIWRKQPEIHTYNPVYFGKNCVQADRKISYAASMGILPEEQSDLKVLGDYLQNLDKISVRESDLKHLVESFGYTCEQHVDPTLLLSGEEWVQAMNVHASEPEKNYLLFYNLMGNSFDVDAIQKFAKARKLELKILYSRAAGRNTNRSITTANPLEFLNLIYNAKFVITSSFHGLVFSLLFKKPFFASFCKNEGRAASLLEIVNLKERLLKPMSDIPMDLKEIDYEQVFLAVDKYKRNSLDYLTKWTVSVPEG